MPRRWRDSGVSAASEKLPDQAQPPTEISVFSCGWRFFNWRSLAKLSGPEVSSAGSPTTICPPAMLAKA